MYRMNQMKRGDFEAIFAVVSSTNWGVERKMGRFDNTNGGSDLQMKMWRTREPGDNDWRQPRKCNSL